MTVDYRIISSERNGDGYFSVTWSPFVRADKYEIVTKVPAIGGIAELYFMDREGKLNLFCLQRSWYGGLRSMIRERSDISLEKDPWRYGILAQWDGRIWYRWTATESAKDMADVMFFLMKSYVPDSDAGEGSGRYNHIYVRETDTGKLVTI